MVEMVSTLVLFLGLGLVLTLAYVAERPGLTGLRWLVGGLVGALDALLMLAGATFGLVMVVPGVAQQLEATYALTLTASAAHQLVTGLPMFGWLCAAAGLLGLMLLWRPMRQAATRWIPIDPDRVVHAVALQYALFAVVSSALTVVVLPAIISGSGPQELEKFSRGTLPSLVGQFVGFVALAALGVGWLVCRDGRATLARLGLTRRFDWRWWLGATAVGLASAWLVDAGWRALSPESLAEVSKISEVLFKPLLSLGLFGAVLAALIPGISEELLFRGAAQPRFGLLLTALLFMVVHTQYTLSPALAQILAMGLVLGLVRERVNTTTAIAVHATYNFVVFALGI
jgi:uncharacterized protein